MSDYPPLYICTSPTHGGRKTMPAVAKKYKCFIPEQILLQNWNKIQYINKKRNLQQKFNGTI